MEVEEVRRDLHVGHVEKYELVQNFTKYGDVMKIWKNRLEHLIIKNSRYDACKIM